MDIAKLYIARVSAGEAQLAMYENRNKDAVMLATKAAEFARRAGAHVAADALERAAFASDTVPSALPDIANREFTFAMGALLQLEEHLDKSIE